MKKNKYIIFSLLGILFLMAVGFAAFSQRLEIGDSSEVTTNWNILITNIETVGGTGTNNTEPSYERLTANFDVSFEEISDYIEYEITVSNIGDVVANLNDIEITNGNSDMVSMTYSGISVGDTLGIGESKTFNVKLLYKGGSGEGTSEITINYAQDANPNGAVIPTDNMVVYDATENGGSSEITKKYYDENEIVDLSVNAKKEGYTFIGWNTDKDAEVGLESYTMTSDGVTLYAIYEKEIKVLYKLSNGVYKISKTEDSCTVYNNNTECTFTMPVIDAAENYQTDGWYDANGTKVGDTVTISKNQTYTSKALYFIPVITFDPNSQLNYTNGTSVKATVDSQLYGLKANQSLTYVWSEDNEAVPIFGKVSTTTDYMYYFTESDGTYTSTNVADNYSTANVEILFDLSFASTLSFDYSVSSEETNDYFYYIVRKYNEEEEYYNYFYDSRDEYDQALSGVTSGTMTHFLPKGKYMLDIQYYKNGSVDGNDDKVIISNVDVNVGASVPLNNEEGTQKAEITIPKNHSSALTGTYYLWAKAGIENIGGYSSEATVSEAFHFDNAEPTITLTTSSTTNSITVVANASALSGISKYEYSIDGGEVVESTSNTHTFTGLEQGTEYWVGVVVTSAMGKTSYSEKSKTTTTIATPTFQQPATFGNQTVIITYPEGCGTEFNCSYIQNDGNEITVEDSTVSLNFTEEGTVIAKVNDGTNYVTSSTYTVIFPIETYNLKGIDVPVYTSGGPSGLYWDPLGISRLVYKGADPNNYVWLDLDDDNSKTDNEYYRIVSVETDGTLKVVAANSINEMAWDENDVRLSEVETDYCYDANVGCNAWGSKTTTYDSTGTNLVTQMPVTIGGTLYNLPEKEASLNTYLNTTFLNSISSDFQTKIATHTFNVGAIYASDSEQALANDVAQEEEYKWKGKIGLINATDYVKASTNRECTNVQSYFYWNWNEGANLCAENSEQHNYLFHNNYGWTISPFAESPHYVWGIHSSGSLMNDSAFSTYYEVYPTFYLTSDITLTGEGTEEQPFEIQ